MRRQQLWIIASLCATIGALLLLAASLPQLSFQPGRVFRLSDALRPSSDANGGLLAGAGDLGPWRVLFALIAVALLLYFLVAVLFSARLRREVLRRIAAGIVVVVLLYLFLSSLRNGPPPEVPPPSTSTAPPQQPPVGEALPPFVAQPAPWLVLLVSLLLAALLLAGIWFLWRRMHPPARENPLADLAREALADIEAGGDVHDTVLRCYLEMSRVLSEQQGMRRQQAVTPREFERQLAAAGLGDEHIRRLTRLFEGARYGATQAGEREQREAVACLTAIVQLYGGA